MRESGAGSQRLQAEGLAQVAQDVGCGFTGRNESSLGHGGLHLPKGWVVRPQQPRGGATFPAPGAGSARSAGVGLGEATARRLAAAIETVPGPLSLGAQGGEPRGSALDCPWAILPIGLFNDGYSRKSDLSGKGFHKMFRTAGAGKHAGGSMRETRWSDGIGACRHALRCARPRDTGPRVGDRNQSAYDRLPTGVAPLYYATINGESNTSACQTKVFTNLDPWRCYTQFNRDIPIWRDHVPVSRA